MRATRYDGASEDTQIRGEDVQSATNESTCPLCGSAFGEGLRRGCELGLTRGFHCFRFTCGACFGKLVASTDHSDRIQVSPDLSGVSGDFPIMEPARS